MALTKNARRVANGLLHWSNLFYPAAMKTKAARPASASTSDLKPAPLDHAAAGETAFAAIEARLLALPSDRLDPVVVDVQIAAITALAIAHAIAADAPLRARFEALAQAKEFDLARLDGLATTALATWFARHRYLLASATHSEAHLPASIVATATTLKGRMMRVVEYHLGDHPVAGALVAAIRAGTGYMDLANDLVALARLYTAYTALLAHDKKDYRAADQGLAAQTGDQILTLLGGSAPEQRKWADQQARAWTLLNRDYAEVAAAGRYLKRADGDVESAFPSLVAASRATASRAGAAASNGQAEAGKGTGSDAGGAPGGGAVK